MEITEAKQFVDICIEAGRPRDKTVELISALPLNGDTLSVFEYIDLKYKMAPESIDTWNFTDAENAEYFTAMYSGRLRYDHRRGRWLEWNGHYWRNDNDGQITRLALKAVRARFYGTTSIDLNDRKEVTTRAITSEQRARLSAMISIAQDLKPIADNGESWDINPWLFAAGNTVIDLKTGQPVPGNQADNITMITPIKYDPAAEAPRWLQFLDEIFELNKDIIHWAHKYFGYCMTGITTEQIIPIGYGSGSNGKTVMLNIVEHTLGDYAYNAPFTMFELNNRSAIPNDLAALDGKRFVTARETTEGSRFNEGRIKALTGCDPITARFLHAEYFTFKPVAKYFLAVNSRPRVHDDSHGWWRRVRLTPFNKRFEGESDDKNLTQLLISEASGILNWLIEGCLLWQKEGLDDTPECIQIATKEYEADSDPLSDFILDECVIHPQAQIKTSVLYKKYKDWAESQGMKDREILTLTAFGRKMKGKCQKIKNRDGIFYQGLALKCEQFVNSFTPNITESNVLPNSLYACENKLEKCSQLFTTHENCSQLPDCPKCGCNKWEPVENQYVCPCGYSMPIEGDN